MSELDPAARAYLADLGRKGSAAKWDGLDEDARRAATAAARRSRSRVPFLEAQVADLTERLERLEQQLRIAA